MKDEPASGERRGRSRAYGTLRAPPLAGRQVASMRKAEGWYRFAIVASFA